ncbi:DUF6891 domain-containing protein [Nocardioides sp. AE5]|uniref:DUF6891 domain-containing protein n=1 Tax=Nocardioides sp. AE5 TaxID=2962573 RepID=UPI0028812563|nr:hypothetical protein [Nocardioides sp. AE5]MDT0201451.1 hypothetical protein [Nocardioides sp. AE5]
MRLGPRSGSESRKRREEHVRLFVRDNLRAGLLNDAALTEEVERAFRDELPWLPVETGQEWLAEEQDSWLADAASWPETTDHDRLQAAFADLETAGVVVLQGCLDHWAAREVLRTRTPERGVAWFLPQDVWHAVDAGMLEVNVWHVSGANVAAGDDLLDLVVASFARHGLAAHFDEGRVEVAAHWQRRPGSFGAMINR